MLCQKCHKKQASVHIKNNINGDISELSLCADCAEKEKLQSFWSFSSDKLFSGFFSDSIFGSDYLPKQKTCPLCGATRADLAASGKAGCAKCYEVFGEELSRIIKSIHGNTLHSGSKPGKHLEQVEKSRKLEALKKEMQSAVEDQNFEKAAQLRDKIKEIESGKEE